jgi:hypothetical protein
MLVHLAHPISYHLVLLDYLLQLIWHLALVAGYVPIISETQIVIGNIGTI